MLQPPTFRSYTSTDRQRCLALFDANCPEFFAVNEREEFLAFLDADAASYLVCERDDAVVGAFGLRAEGAGRSRIRWIKLAPSAQGQGLGRAVMEHAIRVCGSGGDHTLAIAASHKSAPFFARFGAQEVGRSENGWGPGMHRVDMELLL